MAIYHLHVKNGSRAGGQSAHAHAQYVSRDGKYSRERDALVYAESGHMPAWTAERELDYWDAADLYERANGRLFKWVEVALPAMADNTHSVKLGRVVSLGGNQAGSAATSACGSTRTSSTSVS